MQPSAALVSTGDQSFTQRNAAGDVLNSSPESGVPPRPVCHDLALQPPCAAGACCCSLPFAHTYAAPRVHFLVMSLAYTSAIKAGSAGTTLKLPSQPSRGTWRNCCWRACCGGGDATCSTTPVGNARSRPFLGFYLPNVAHAGKQAADGQTDSQAGGRRASKQAGRHAGR